MRNKKVKKIGLSLALVAFALALGFGLMNTVNVYARRTVTEVYTAIMDKAVYQGVYKCYNNGFVVQSIKPLSDYTGVNSLMAKEDSKEYENYIPLVTGVKAGSVFEHVRYSIKDSGLSCNQLFEGGSYWVNNYNDSLLTATGHKAPDRGETQQVIDFIKGMGYEVTETSQDRCYSLSFTVSGELLGDSSKVYITDPVCQKKSDGSLHEQITDGNRRIFRVSGDKVCLYMYTDNLGQGAPYKTSWGEPTSCEVFQKTQTFDGSWLMDFVGRQCGNKYECSSYTEWDGSSLTYKFDYHTDGVQEQGALSNYVAKINDTGSAALAAVRYLSDDQKYTAKSSIEIGGLEKRVLYQSYLASYYEVQIDCAQDIYEGWGDGEINWFDTNDLKMKKCRYSLANATNRNKPVNGIDGNGFFQYESISGLEELLNIFKSLPTSYSEDEIEGIEEDIETGTEGDPGNPGKVKDNCLNAGGAGSLGWIVCPVLTWMTEASKELYNDFVEPALNISPKLFSDSDSETKKAWDTFQGFANIILIIIFLIIIFSQLTGWGIDNYGVKKILPRLIMIALLMNLSYYICLIFIDASNIIGNGIQSLFESLGGALNLEHTESIGSQVLATGLTAVPILAAIMAGAVAIWANPAILLTLLISALGVVITVFLLFILLSVRQAAIVVLTVMSPLAFVCYTLPNTKRIYDKWFNLSKALLLVYPICGLLVGGGGYVSRLLLASGMGGDFVNALSALMVSIIPIFLIPTVLRESLAGLGSLWAKVSGFGQRLPGVATRFARNTEGYKNAQNMGLERRTRFKAGLDRDGNLTRRGEKMAGRAQSGIGKFFGADKRQAAYLAAAKKNMAAGEAAGAALSGALARTGISNADALPDPHGELGSAFGAKTEGAYYGGQFLDAARRGDITGMNAAIEAMRASNMKAKDIAKIVRYATNNNYLNSLDENTRSAWARDMAKRYGSDFMSTDFELSTWMRNGGVGSLGGYGTYASSLISSGSLGMDDIKPEDISKMSGDSLVGMAMAGLIDQSMAQRVLATSPNLSADKKIMLGALANGAKVTDVNQFKNDAKAIMNSNFSGGSGTMTIGGVTVTQTMRDAWTASTPQEVNVVQNFQGGGRQFVPVDVRIDHGSTSTPTPSTPPTPTPPTPTPPTPTPPTPSAGP